MENTLLNNEKALIRINNEKCNSIAKFILLTGQTAKNFDDAAKVCFPNIDFKKQIESKNKILLKARI